jgi:hypothetical protein
MSNITKISGSNDSTVNEEIEVTWSQYRDNAVPEKIIVSDSSVNLFFV